MRQSHRQQAQHGEEAGHQHRAQAQHRALQHRLFSRGAMVFQLVVISDHHHAVEYRLPEQGDKPDSGRNRQRDAGDKQREDATDQRERNVQHDQQRALERLKGIEQQDENQQDGQGHDNRQSRHGALLILKLARPANRVALGQLERLTHPRLHVGNHTTHVAIADKHAH